MSTAVISPGLPPAMGGVGDYAIQLWRRWSDPPPDWTFVVYHDGDGAVRVDNAGALESVLGGHTLVLLQFTAFGLAPNGIPRWLAEGLQGWKRPESRLVTMFHEIFSPRRLTGRSLWRAPQQKELIRKVGVLSDVCLTSTPWFAAQLRTIGVNAALCPVPSAIPQAPAHDRKGERLVVTVFGIPGKRRLALKSHHRLLKRLHEADRLDRLVLVGAPDAADLSPRHLPSRAFLEKTQFLGALPPDAVARVLAESDLLLMPHHAREVRKSSAAAAGMLNGCALVMIGQGGDVPAFSYDGSAAGVSRLLNRLSRERIALMQAAGQAWYREHASWQSCIRIWREAAEHGPRVPT